MADKDEADSPDESAATPGDGSSDDALDHDAGAESISDDGAEAAAEPDPHAADDAAREPTLEELEQMLQGDDPSDHDGADLDPTDEPAELAVDNSDSGSDTDGDSDGDGGRDGELVSVGAAPRSRGKTAESGADGDSSLDTPAAKKEREKKERATPKQKQEVVKQKRTTPVGFVKEAVGELRKVVYPTAPQLGNYFIVVLVFVLFIIAFVGGLDVGFGALIVKIFG